MKMKNMILVLALSVASINAYAEGSTQHSGQASKHSTLAAGHGLASTAKTASAAVAIPLVVAGSIAMVPAQISVDAGKKLMKVAKGEKKQQGLVITETTITADPAPDQIIIIQTKQHSH